MLLRPQTLAANGYSPWIIPSPGISPPLAPTLALMLSFSEDANLTADVQYTYDDPAQNPRAVTMARAGGTLTITDLDHGLNAGDAVQLSNDAQDANNIWGASPQSLPGGTNYDVVTTPDPNTYTVAVANSGPAAASGFVRSFRLFFHPVLKGVAGAPPARIDAPHYWRIGAARLKVSNWLAGKATLEITQ